MFFTILFFLRYFIIIHSWSFNNIIMSSSQLTLPFIEKIELGIHIGLKECEAQFRWSRWNCPEENLQNLFNANKLGATRETAYIRAIVSAGIVHTMTNSCNVGNNQNCSCESNSIEENHKLKNDFVWKGCNSLKFAISLAKLYMDTQETGKDSLASINLYNNEVGRLAVLKTLVKSCRCHGISGSCTVKSCWMSLNTFQEIGRYLKIAYNQAQKVESNVESLDYSKYNEDDNVYSFHINNHKSDLQKKEPTDSDENIISNNSLGLMAKDKLVYAEDSPDYCVYNASIVSMGTLGRKCSNKEHASKEERNSCENLCLSCGYKVINFIENVQHKCNCTFNWCCKVECALCTEKEISQCVL